MNGDVIASSEGINRLAAQNDTTLSTIKVDGGEELGYIELDGEQVINIYEKTAKPPGNLANAGLYLFSPPVFEAISKTRLSPRGNTRLLIL